MTIKRPFRLGFTAQSLVLVGSFGLFAWSLPAAGPLEFGVRSMVVDDTGPTPAGQSYAILSVQMASSDPQKIVPVDEDALVNQVCDMLDRRGFHRATPGQNPDTLITVHYGRAWLRNPYLHATGDSQVIEGFSTLPIVDRPTMNVTGLPTRLMDEATRSYQAKLDKASLEKLYIRVTGWRYPADARAKARMRWKTTVLLDEPDHWNLNAVAGDMLAAGMPYFARPINQPELEIHPPLPEGHVEIGPANVVNSPFPKAAPALSPPVPGARHAVIAGRKFDVPAGEAAASLQVFSQQSGEEIIYPVAQLRGIRTRAVRGEMAARAALDRLLDGTGLSAVQDEKSEALVVRAAIPR